MLTIGDVAKRTGVNASALRYYESEKLIAAPMRRNGRRVYDDTVFAQIAIIHVGQAAGLTIRELRELVAGGSARTRTMSHWRTLLQTKLADVNAQLASLGRTKELLESSVECRCANLAECARRILEPRNDARDGAPPL